MVEPEREEATTMNPLHEHVPRDTMISPPSTTVDLYLVDTHVMLSPTHGLHDPSHV